MVETVKNDGGQAFPTITEIEAPHTINHMTPKWSRVNSGGGMSLRDWFAGQALPVVAAVIVAPGVETDDGEPASSRHVARAAYDIADAMLAERSK